MVKLNELLITGKNFRGHQKNDREDRQGAGVGNDEEDFRIDAFWIGLTVFLSALKLDELKEWDWVWVIISNWGVVLFMTLRIIFEFLMSG